MLNKLWPIFIIVSFAYAIFFGNLENLNSAIFNSTSDAVNLSINLLRNNVFMEWNYASCQQDKYNNKIN